MIPSTCRSVSASLSYHNAQAPRAAENALRYHPSVPAAGAVLRSSLAAKSPQETQSAAGTPLQIEWNLQKGPDVKTPSYCHIGHMVLIWARNYWFSPSLDL